MTWPTRLPSHGSVPRPATVAIERRTCLRREAAGLPLYVIPGAVLKKGASDLGEVGLLGYMAEHLILGEVKTSPADFNEDQVKKDLSLAAQISADIYVMVTVRPLTEGRKAWPPVWRPPRDADCSRSPFVGPPGHIVVTALYDVTAPAAGRVAG